MVRIFHETEAPGTCQLASALPWSGVPAFVQFLSGLFEVGQVSVPVLGQDDGPDFDSLRAHEQIAARDHVLRLSSAGKLPELDPSVALLGGRALYLASQLYVDRARPTAALEGSVNEIGKLSPTPVHVHSLDITLAFLPDLHAHAGNLCSDDGLMTALDRLALWWPLSSIGIAESDSLWERHAPWWEEESLRQCYVDRVLERDDAARLQHHSKVATAVRGAFGERLDTLAGGTVRDFLST